MADVLLKEWLVKGHGTEYMLVSADAMDMLFEDLYQTLAVAPTIIEDEQLHKQIVDAALVRAADAGWKFGNWKKRFDGLIGEDKGGNHDLRILNIKCSSLLTFFSR